MAVVFFIGQDSGDADAQAYIDACGITDATEIAAVEQWFLDVKGQGLTPNGNNIYSKYIARYLMSPTSIAAAACNAVNPGTFDLTFVNGPTHSANGVKFDGLTQYATTDIVVSTDMTDNDVYLDYYSRTSFTQTATAIGCRHSASQRLEWRLNQLYLGNNNMRSTIYEFATELVTLNANASGGVQTTRRSATDIENYRKAVSLGSAANGGGTVPTIQLYLNATNNLGTAQDEADYQCVGASVATGMTDAEVADAYDADQRYQTNVIVGGREV